MSEPSVNNNEFDAAESELKKIGSNLWFGGLSEEWQDFLVRNAVDHFDGSGITMSDAARDMIRVYEELVRKDPGLLDMNPWDVVLKGE